MTSPPGKTSPHATSSTTSFSTAGLTHALLERGPLLIYVVDLEGRILLTNRAFTETTGWTQEDCSDLDSLLERLYPEPEYRDVVRRVHMSRSAGSQIDSMELTLRCKDGSDALVAWSSAWLTDPGGQAAGYAFLGADSTSTRNLRHLLFLFRSAVEGVQEAVILTDPAGRIFSWNAGATELLGLTAEAVEGRVLAEFYEPNSDPETALADDGHFEGLVDMRLADGTSRPLAMSLRRLETDAGAQAARLCVLAPPNVEDELRQRVNDLASKIAELEDELQQHDGADDRHEASLAELRALAREEASQASELLESIRQEAIRDASSAKETLAAARGQADELTSRNENLRDQVRHTEDKLSKTENDLDEARREVSDVRLALNDAEQKATEANKRADAAEERAEDANKSSEQDSALIAELENKLAEARKHAESAQAEIDGQEQELERLAAALATSAEALEKADEDRDRERNESEERHRQNLEALSQRLAAERLALEEQLSRDILAAEDRAATERERAESGFERDREDWEAAIASARAEAEAKHREEIEQLRSQLAKSGNELGTDQVSSRTIAVASADMSGVVVGWSDGASSLDGHSQAEALGTRIHEDVLCLEGIDWKTLVGRIIISGHLEQEYVLISSDGIRTPVLLIADLVRGQGGAPTGLTEFLVPQLSRGDGGEITDVSNIMELMEDDTEAMDMRGVGDQPEEPSPKDSDTTSANTSTAEQAEKQSKKPSKSNDDTKKTKKSKKPKK